tara:strand:+ start:1066 stop:2058 length:993 start_codon:yes stop_codon:yes gene_type:complete
MIKYKIAIIGCGLIGNKRASALNSNYKIEYCCDTRIEILDKFYKKYKCSNKTIDWKEVVRSNNVDIAIVALTHNLLFQVTKKLLESGKHVLVEKPGSIKSSQLEKLSSLAKNNNCQLHVGYNSRYLKSIKKSLEIIKKDKSLGKLNYIRAVYGHGGRPGYEKEWRGNKKLAGGGELLDQGSHIIDLAYLYTNSEFKIKGADLGNYFWNMKVEDNAFLLLKNKENVILNMHVSWTEWKNKFLFEIFFKNGKIEISGRGGSYGEEKLIFYKMQKKMGPPKKKLWAFKNIDSTWKDEWTDFVKEISLKNINTKNLLDSIKVLKIIDLAYNNSK